MSKPPRTPMRVWVLHHPKSDSAQALARALHGAFTEGIGSPGMRIPVLYGPSHEGGLPPARSDLDLESAAHSVVVVLVDERMARRAGKAATGREWGDLLFDLLKWAPAGKTPHAVLPVAIDNKAFDLDKRLEKNSFIRLDVLKRERQAEQLDFQVNVRVLHLLIRGAVPSDNAEVAPVELFISHTKLDLSPDPDDVKGPVKALLAQLAQGPVDHWYDAKHIPPGGRFDEEIRDGVLKSSAMVCIVTDEYSSREWCRREALEAKEAGRPILVVDALSGQVPRTFPYLGNTPVVRWNGKKRDARRIVYVAVREALRYRHSLEVLRAQCRPYEVALGIAPEALTVASLPAGTKCVLYPDLPLGKEELERLEQLAPGVEFTTPLSRLARWERPQGVDLIGLSLSNSPDAPSYGMSEEHLSQFAEDTVLFLLLAGLRLAYGGGFGQQGSATNYIERLIDVARSQSPLGSRVGVDFMPIVNYVGWPIHARYGNDEYQLYGPEAELVEVPAPAELGVELASLDPDANGFFPPGAEDPNLAARRRYAWARGMTAMRERMTSDTTARIVMGGKLAGYAGVLPGVLEEALLSLRGGKPLYLIGAFGGAGRLAVDALEGRARGELTTEAMRAAVPQYDQTVALFKSTGSPIEAPDAIAAELAARGEHGPAAALTNGLDDSENREMFSSNDPMRLVELVLLGLGRWSDQHHD